MLWGLLVIRHFSLLQFTSNTKQESRLRISLPIHKLLPNTKPVSCHPQRLLQWRQWDRLHFCTSLQNTSQGPSVWLQPWQLLLPASCNGIEQHGPADAGIQTLHGESRSINNNSTPISMKCKHMERWSTAELSCVGSMYKARLSPSLGSYHMQAPMPHLHLWKYLNKVLFLSFILAVQIKSVIQL